MWTNWGILDISRLKVFEIQLTGKSGSYLDKQLTFSDYSVKLGKIGQLSITQWCRKPTEVVSNIGVTVS